MRVVEKLKEVWAEIDQAFNPGREGDSEQIALLEQGLGKAGLIDVEGNIIDQNVTDELAKDEKE